MQTYTVLVTLLIVKIQLNNQQVAMELVTMHNSWYDYISEWNALFWPFIWLL